MSFNLTVGITNEKSEMVSDNNTAIKYGSGSIAVYATPAMVGLMEGACLDAIEHLMPEGMSTVGISIDIRHSAATPVGMKVRAVAELVEIAGKRLVFRIEAFDEKEKIGEGIHQRYVVDVAKFLQKCNAKK